MGKGSRRRPTEVDDETFEQRWERTFGPRRCAEYVTGKTRLERMTHSFVPFDEQLRLCYGAERDDC